MGCGRSRCRALTKFDDPVPTYTRTCGTSEKRRCTLRKYCANTRRGVQMSKMAKELDNYRGGASYEPFNLFLFW